MQHFESVRELARLVRPDEPFTCLRPQASRAAARRFVDRFDGRVFYAVKANPHPVILSAIAQGGVRAFDAASLDEIRLVRETLPDAEIAFLHPVKSRRAIATAWELGVRTFAVDCLGEVRKIAEIVPEIRQATLIVRLSVPDGDSGVCLAHKFGASGVEAAELLRTCREIAHRVGVSFHVGSQAMRPEAYAHAMEVASGVVRAAGVLVDIVDVGGGFPVRYPGREPVDLEQYFQVIDEAVEQMPIPGTAELWAEPGRALCAASGSVLARVELRKGRSLYLNDGTYGGLFDASKWVGFRFPVRAVRLDGEPGASQLPFELYGPTCDGLDHMPGPFYLPEDIDEGDYVELGMLGAYSQSMRTRFNGFGADQVAVVADAPVIHVPVATDRVAEEIRP